MPLAVSNAPGVFMEYMNRIFDAYLDQFLVVIIEDVLRYLKLDMDHAENMSYSLSKLAEEYIERIANFHDIPLSIVFDTNLRYTSRFLESLQESIGESVVLKYEIIQQTSEKIKMNQEKMKASQIHQKSYHDKISKALEFQEGDHVFLRVTPVSGVGQALKSRKFTPCFIGLYQILGRVGEVAYRVALPPFLSNLHNVFHVSLLRKYIPDPFYVIQVDSVQVRENLTAEASPSRVENPEVKHLRDKEIVLVKVVSGGPTSGSMTWEPVRCQIVLIFTHVFGTFRLFYSHILGSPFILK
ncbi:uncharacterized protein LOC131625106 [Vicia villosa]|uniref:uncharacterized protein LOC131625106 n=1 Tax=Vicia villosa TaxID=3911 RepID=UPI00273CB170|nr:uncharacterized protein LOC131625106 [Vicia villosa]